MVWRKGGLEGRRGGQEDRGLEDWRARGQEDRRTGGQDKRN
jgi:hypothetical protein